MQTYRGVWWLPDDDVQQPGLLTISDRGDVTLELIGGFDLNARTSVEGGGWAAHENQRPMPLIHGRADNQDITIQDAWTEHSTSGIRFSDRPRFHRIRGNRAFIGVHLASDKLDAWGGCWVQLENLAAWLASGSVRRSAELRSKFAELVDVEDQRVEVDGWTYTVVTRHGGFDFDVRRGDVSVTGLTSTRLHIAAPEPCTVEVLDERVKSFMDLLTLATGTACGVIAMSVVPRPAPPTSPPAGRLSRFDPDIPVHVRRIREVQPGGAAPTVWRFTCADKPFEDLVAAWVPLQRTAIAGTSAYFGNYYDRAGYTESRALLNAVAAEATHRALNISQGERELSDEDFVDRRRRALDAMTTEVERAWIRRKLSNNPAQPSFRQRMRSIVETIDATAIAAIMGDVELWLTDITETRNGLAHEAVGLGDRLLELEEATDVTVAAYLMALLGLDAEAQQRAASLVRRVY